MPVDINGEFLPADVLQTRIDDRIPCYLIRRDEFFDRSHLYGTPEGDYYDNDLRFIYFSKAVFSLCRALSYFPDVMHCHDWQAALVPAYLRYMFGRTAGFFRSRSMLTIHNLAYQGVFPAGTFFRTGLPGSFFSVDGMEFWGNTNFLKAGIVCSDILTTVSPTYSREVLSPEFGYGLEGVLAARADDLYGILNGADYDEWDPARDPFIPCRYDADRLESKRQCKESLIKEMDLRAEAEGAPLFGMISRMTSQKGMDLLTAAARGMMELGVHCVILGDGEERYRADCESLVRKFPGRFSVRFGFDNPLAHRIQAGCDFLMMPSRYEPCGLNQLYAMRYGTVPLVRSTGGLRDTVTEFKPATGAGTGFLFHAHDPGLFVDTVRRAVALFEGQGTGWDRIRTNGMDERFSWERSAREYKRMYERLRSSP
jgi:starch synthase